jgi:hypothetical protein
VFLKTLGHPGALVHQVTFLLRQVTIRLCRVSYQ